MQFLKKLIFGCICLVFISCASTLKSTYKLPDFREVRLENGLKLLLIKDNRLPSFSLTMVNRSGSYLDSVVESDGRPPGLTNMVAELLDKGAGGLSASQIADRFGILGTSFSAWTGPDYSVFKTSGLSMHQDKILENFFTVITRPDFKENELNRVKGRVLAEIKKAVDQPQEFAQLQLQKVIFGDHPYGFPVDGTVAGVQSIKLDQVKLLYKKYFTPNRSILAIIGNYNDDVVEKVKLLSKDWKAGSAEVASFKKVQEMNGLNVHLITKEDLKQSEVLLGHRGIKRSNPDSLTLKLANTVLGQTMSSRLFTEIREKRGLTYGVFSQFINMLDRGYFFVDASTRHEKVGELLKETINQIELFKEKGITKEELIMAKGYLKGLFPQILETPESVAENILVLDIYGVDRSYLRDYYKNLDDIDLDDVNQAIKKYYKPENFQVVVFSPKKTEEQVKSVGQLSLQNYKALLN